MLAQHDALLNAMRKHQLRAIDKKVERYIDAFFDMTRMEDQISGRVEGNHGVYTVSFGLTDGVLRAVCSCYIGSGGGCHHCAALAHTFLRNPEQFKAIERVERSAITTLEDVAAYVRSRPLADLLADLRAAGITQKAFCEAIGMNPRHLSAVNSSEKRNHYFNELGAIKLAAIWALENLEAPESDKPKTKKRQ